MFLCGMRSFANQEHLLEFTSFDIADIMIGSTYIIYMSGELNSIIFLETISFTFWHPKVINGGTTGLAGLVSFQNNKIAYFQTFFEYSKRKISRFWPSDIEIMKRVKTTTITSSSKNIPINPRVEALYFGAVLLLNIHILTLKAFHNLSLNELILLSKSGFYFMK